MHRMAIAPLTVLAFASLPLPASVLAQDAPAPAPSAPPALIAAPPAAAPQCRSPLTGFSVAKTEEGYTLEVEIANEAGEGATDLEFNTGSNTLRLQAVEAGSGNALPAPVALPAPNVENLVLKPGENFKQTFLLDTLILGLKDTLARTDVRLSWILDLDPRDACVSLSARGSALLKH